MGARLGEIFKENVNFKFMDIIDSRIYKSLCCFFFSFTRVRRQREFINKLRINKMLRELQTRFVEESRFNTRRRINNRGVYRVDLA